MARSLFSPWVSLIIIALCLSCTDSEDGSDAAGSGGDSSGGSATGDESDGGSTTGGESTGGNSSGGESNGGSATGGETAGGAGGGSSGGTAGEGDVGPGGEYIDEDGRCRAERAPLTECPATFEAAQALDTPCASPCSGDCGGATVSIRFCTPTRGCAYDPDTGEHIGTMFGDDVRGHCDLTSYTVISGDWPLAPDGCELTPRDDGDTCPPNYVP